MEKEFLDLLNDLKNYKLSLEDERNVFFDQINQKNEQRKMAANLCLDRALPYLSKTTISNLQSNFPNFDIPMVSSWFGLFKKINPDVSLESLKINLGHYLDSENLWPDYVNYFDKEISLIQNNDIDKLTSEIFEIDQAIQKISSLLDKNLDNLNPELLEKFKKAIKEIKKNKDFPKSQFLNSRYIQEKKSDDGPDILDYWFWYQILSPNSDLNAEISSIESSVFTDQPREGKFDGAGAEILLDEVDNNTSPINTEESSQKTDDLSVHIALGADNFS